MPRRRLALLLVLVGVVVLGVGCGERDDERLQESGQVVRVLVTDEAGTPVPRALLRVHRISSEPRETFEVDVIQGVAEFEARPDSGTYHVLVGEACDLEGHPLNLMGARKKNVLRSGREVRIVLWPGREVSGQVLRDDGEPGAGLVVVASNTRYGDVGPFTTTDEQGRFTLHRVPTSSVFVRLLDGQGWTVMLPRPVEPDVSEVEVEVIRVSDIEVLVLDPHGTPLQGATVTVDCERTYEKREGRTSAAGRFVAKGCAQDAGCRIDVDPTACSPPYPKVSLDVPSPRGDRHTIRVPGAAYIRGRVLDPDGKPVSSTSVRAQLVGTSESHGATTDDEGHFDMGPLPPGNYAVRVKYPPGGWLPPRGVYLEAPCRGAELVCVRPVTITGRIWPADVSRTEVTWNGAPGGLRGDFGIAKIESDGSFRIDGIYPGLGSLSIGKESACLAWISGLDTADSPFDIDTTLWQDIRGRVEDSRPHPRSEVYFSLRRREIERVLRISEDGSFKTPRVPPGLYQLIAFDAEEGPLPPLAVREGDHDVILTLKLE